MASEPTWIRDANASATAGDLLAARVEGLARSEPAPRLAIPGGSALAALARARERLGAQGVPWERLRLTWVDERCVPLASPDSNRGCASRAGLLDAPAAAQTLPLYLDGESPELAVARVEAALDEGFDGALDVLLLGMGEDGHVASLFPGAADAPVAPAGSARVAYVSASPKPPRERITLTRTLLASARHTVLLATGEGKRDALRRLRDGDESLPASGLTDLTVVTDLDL